MLDQERDLDGVLIATPDHTHAYISAYCMRAGLPVYCEKPLTHNIWEARQLRKIAAETGVATQMGNQLHSSEGIRKTVEYLKSDVIGKVKEVHVWVGASRWAVEIKGLPKEEHSIPSGLNWDLWLGPRAMRPFHSTFAPVSWRDYWEFGAGAMGDFGCHDLDAVVWGLDLDLPKSVQLFPAGYTDEHVAPYGEIGYFEFEHKNEPLPLTWYTGGLRPKIPDGMPADIELGGRGAIYVGEKGVMYYEGRGQAPKLFPEALEESTTNLSFTLPETNGHWRDWIDAIKGGPTPSSHFTYATHLTEITLLGVLSLRLGSKKVHWDAESMTAIGMPEADQYIKEEMREGWAF